MSDAGLWMTARLAASIAVACVAKIIAELADLWMPVWLAGLIGLALVFGGWLIIVIVDES